jgi:hypothetical protein
MEPFYFLTLRTLYLFTNFVRRHSMLSVFVALNYKYLEVQSFFNVFANICSSK